MPPSVRRHLSSLAAVLLLAACTRGDANRPADTGTVDRPDAPEGANPTVGDQPAGTDLASLRSQLDQFGTDPKNWSAANRTAHKGLVGDFIRRAETELARNGKLGDPGFQALRDSVTRVLGGGTGVADGPDPERIGDYRALLDRMITRYETLSGGASE